MTDLYRQTLDALYAERDELRGHIDRLRHVEAAIRANEDLLGIRPARPARRPLARSAHGNGTAALIYDVLRAEPGRRFTIPDLREQLEARGWAFAGDPVNGDVHTAIRAAANRLRESVAGVELRDARFSLRPSDEAAA